ncbi:MAG TPA: PmoA family protein [Bryobacteraceae bacterium]|nr:PmoA family protein [Bryobacteraceae bacterium]
MRLSLTLLLATGACLSAQVRFARDQISVDIDGKPFTTFHYGAESGKPYLAPLRSASGKIVTRHFPMEEIPGESRDHLHHTGLWFSYDDVNGVKFWENDPSYTKPHIGRIVVRNAEWKDGGRTGTLTATMDWRDPDGKVLLTETRNMRFAADPKLRTIDFEITLTAAVDVTFGDTKEGAFAIRLADSFTERKGMRMVDADGRATMAKVWGKRSNWVDYTAEVEGERLGVAMFDHPQNPRHPTYWHARDYGLFALNPFGKNAFDPDQEESHWKLPAGQKVVFRWRVVIHPGDAESGHVADLYRDYASGR